MYSQSKISILFTYKAFFTSRFQHRRYYICYTTPFTFSRCLIEFKSDAFENKNNLLLIRLFLIRFTSTLQTNLVLYFYNKLNYLVYTVVFHRIAYRENIIMSTFLWTNRSHLTYLMILIKLLPVIYVQFDF